MQRRSFLKTLGGALGCLVISSCGSSNDVLGVSGQSGAPTANAYRFTSLVRTGEQIPASTRGQGFSAGRFPGTAIINDLGEVYVHVDTPSEQSTLLKLQLDLSQTSPTVVSTETAAWSGMSLPGNLTVKELELASTNDIGGLVFRALLSNNEHGYYLRQAGSHALQRLAPANSEAPQTGGKFGHQWGDFQLLDDGSLLLIGAYSGEAGTSLVCHQGLFHLPQSTPGRLLLSTADLLPGTGERIGTLGLLDADGDEVHYVQQIWVGRPPVSNSDVPDGSIRSVLVQGSLAEGGGSAARLLHVDPGIMVAESVRAQVLTASTQHGARIDPRGVVASVVETSAGEEFNYAGQSILRSGGLSPLGGTITGFSGPVVGGAAGLAFGHLFTEDGGSEVFVTSGSAPRTVLSTGIAIDGKTIASLAFGLVRDQDDQDGRILAFAQFTDQSQALLLGQPV